uniref:Putative secreted salivary protein n=1 Tax=Ixodes scapularis TaxID=6945 RepID=Q4PN38_IXOSC|nr:putative secreted salivary protein [Ixodes scapularis]
MLHIFCWAYLRALCCTASARDVNLLSCLPARKCNVPEINGWISKVVCREFCCRVCCIYSRPC